MKMQNKMVASGVIIFAMFVGQSLALAEDEISDREYCQQEAEAAGMVEADEIREYIAQCMQEISPSQDDSGDEGADMDMEEHDSEH